MSRDMAVRIIILCPPDISFTADRSNGFSYNLSYDDGRVKRSFISTLMTRIKKDRKTQLPVRSETECQAIRLSQIISIHISGDTALR